MCDFSGRETWTWGVFCSQTMWKTLSKRQEKHLPEHPHLPQSPGRDVGTVSWTLLSFRCVTLDVCNAASLLHGCTEHHVFVFQKLQTSEKKRETHVKWLWHLLLVIQQIDQSINCTIHSNAVSLDESLVSHDPSEIIVICWFAAQETFLIIISVESSCAS